LHLPNSLHEILQILSLTMFETTPINQLLTPTDPDKHSEFEPQQLSLSSEKRWDTTDRSFELNFESFFISTKILTC